MQELQLKLGGARNAISCADHTGREFPSVAAMCRAWGIPPVHYYNRRRRNWSLERALTTPYHVPFRPVVDPETGMEYRSAAAIARACGIKPLTMQARLRKGMTGAALVFPGSLRKVAARDHTGRVFPSLAAMAAAWGQPYKRFERRLSSGWDIERALTAPRTHGGRPKNKEKK